jgi:hypothetical protein
MPAKDYNRVFIVTSLVLLVATAVTNVVVDPFARFGTGLVEPVVRSSRRDKTELATQRPAPDQVVILGSSRAMSADPEFVRQRTGKRAFNAAVNSARTEDYLAMLRFVLQHGWAPHIVVLGLDIEAFHNGRGFDDEFLAVSELNRHIDVPLRTRVPEVPLGQQESVSSLLALQHAIFRRPPAATSYRSDGFLVYDQAERQLAAGTFDLEGTLASSAREYVARFGGYSALSAPRVGYFRELLALCQTRGIQLLVFVTVLHPSVVEALSAGSSYAARRMEVLDLLKGEERRGGLRFFDASSLRSFDGDPALFYDGTHPRATNVSRILARLL